MFSLAGLGEEDHTSSPFSRPLHLPPICDDCGLYKNCRSPGMQPEFDDRRGIDRLETAPTVLVLGQQPGQKEDNANQVFFNQTSGNKLLRLILSRLECRWILDNAVKCFPGSTPDGRGTVSPTQEQFGFCGEAFLRDLIREHDPKVIVCLGELAGKALLGKKMPKSISAAKGPIPLPGYENKWVLLTYHPVVHQLPSAKSRGTRYGRDLRQEYLRVFSKAEELCYFGPRRLDFTYRVIRDYHEAIDFARNLTVEELIPDVENISNRAVPDKSSLWQPRAKMLCMSISYLAQEGDERPSIKTVVFPQNIITSELLTLLFTKRRIGGTNFKYDTNVIRQNTRHLTLDMPHHLQGINVLDLAMKDEPGNEINWFDTVEDSYLPDQDQLGNDLEGQCRLHLDMMPWKDMVWEPVDKLNAQILEHNKRMNAHNRRLDNLKIKWHKGEDTYKYYETNPETGKKKYVTKELPSLEELESSYQKLQEPADFGDIDQELLYRYCAKDTFGNAALKYLHFDKVPEEKQPHPVTRELFRRAMYGCSRLEFTGLPMDKERLEALRVVHLNRANYFKGSLLQQPEVHAALLDVPDFRKLVKRAHRNRSFRRSDVFDLIKERGDKFFEGLLRRTWGVEGYPLTEPKPGKPNSGGKLSKKESDIAWLAGIKKKEGVWVNNVPERHRYHDIWAQFFFCRKSMNMISKFIDGFLRALVNGWVHTTYKIAKYEGVSRAAGADDEGGGAQTGRLSSAFPINLQNLAHDPFLRSCVIAPEGWEILEFDYDRIEPVVLSLLSDCAAWKEIFRLKLDLYTMMANQLYGLGIELTGDTEVDNAALKKACGKDRRDLLKKLVLGVMYEKGEEAFAEDAFGAAIQKGEMTWEDALQKAREFYANFYTAYPEIKLYKERITALLNAGEKVETLFHRLRSFPLVGDAGKQRRRAINFPVQASASDITLWKLWEILRFLDTTGLIYDCYPINVVHDAIWFLVRKEKRAELMPKLASIMEDMSTLPFRFDVPLMTSPKVGPHLGAIDEIKGNEWRHYQPPTTMAA